MSALEVQCEALASCGTTLKGRTTETRGDNMKTTVKRIIRDEKGTVMILALILLVVGGLILAPMLGLMTTGLIAGQVYERKTDELYAADAGVEDAIWKLQNDVVKPPESCGDPDYWSYNISDVNDRNVAVNITYIDGPTFHVVSTATGDGSGTEIEAYITGANKYGDYSGIVDNVLTSLGEINLKPGTNVTPLEGEHSPVQDYGGGWPEPGELEGFYRQQVEDEDPYPFGTIDLNGVDMDLGPLYREGELEIVNSSNTLATLTLTGTIYITGDTLIGKTGKDFTLDLNDQTIFVASNTTGAQNALEIGGKCTIEGPGVLLAIGDIYFEPNIEAGMTDPIFIMSVWGQTLLQPGGDFYGSIAGSVEVDLQPGTSLTYPEDEGWYEDLNFLIGVQELVYTIVSWTVGPA